jgi:hypothetical protein
MWRRRPSRSRQPVKQQISLTVDVPKRSWAWLAAGPRPAAATQVINAVAQRVSTRPTGVDIRGEHRILLHVGGCRLFTRYDWERTGNTQL